MMAKPDNVYKKFSDASSVAIGRTVSVVREYFPYVILALNVLVTVVSRLFETGLVNPFSVEFFLSLSTNLLSTMFCYACFTAYGEKAEKAATPAFSENRKRWSHLSGVVRSGASELFTAFCKAQIEAEREERREEILSNHTLINKGTYEEKYKGISKSDLKKLVTEGSISKTDAKYIRKADRVRVKPIRPLIILCGVKAGHINEAGRSSLSYSTVSVLSRPLVVFITNAIVTSICGRWIGVSDASVMYDMIFLSLLIVISSILGYSAGATSARREHDKIKTRIFFLEKFIEKTPEMQTKLNISA